MADERLQHLVQGIEVKSYDRFILIRQKVNAVILKSSEAVEFENAVKSVLEGNPYTCPRFQSIRQKLSLSPVQIHSKDIHIKNSI